MNSIFKRTISILLVFVLCVSMLPASALAEDAAEPAETEESVEATEPAETEEETADSTETLPEEQTEELSPSNEDESAEQEPESESTELLVSKDISEEEPAQLNASNTSIVASGTCGDNLTWTLDEDGLLTISGTGSMPGYSSDGVPWFSNRSSIKSVKIESGVTSIGNYAFYYCTSLTSIEIPDSVTGIGDYAFYYCIRLTAVYITDIAAWCSISFEGADANPLCYAHNLYLNGEKVTALKIPSGVTSIGDDAFYGCTSLTSIEIPDSVTSIGNWAFYNCTSLTGVYITDIAAWCQISLSFGDYCANPLSYAHNLYLNGEKVTALKIPSGVTSIGNKAFYCCTSLTSVEMPNSVTSIGNCAFSDCTSLTRVELPNSVTSIGSRAFCYCTSLTRVELPNSVISIGNEAFVYCDSLTEIIFYHNAEQTMTIGSDAFVIHSSGGSAIATTIKVIDPDNINTAISGYSWKYSNRTVSYEKIPAIVDSGSCGESLKWTLDEDGLLTISGTGDMYDYTYRGSNNPPWIDYYTDIREVDVDTGVTSIGKNAFYGVFSNIEKITFNSTSLQLNDYAFGSCTGLKSIDFGSGTITAGQCVFCDCDALETITIPSNFIFDGSYTGTGSGYALFQSCDSLKSAVVECSYVSPFMFEKCYSLSTVTFSNPDTEFYFLEHNSGHPFNASREVNIEIIAYACSEAAKLTRVSHSYNSYINLTFTQIKGDTTEHTLVTDAAVEPTAENSGLTEGSHCSACGWINAAQKKTYLVSYNSGDGTGAPENQIKIEGETLILSDTIPVRENYSFLGWTTDSAATEAEYQPGGEYTNNASAVLYAVWDINRYSVSYNANGGKGAPESQTKAYGQTLVLSDAVPTKTGYKFLGWADSTEATAAQYQPGDSYTLIADITLYAVWEAYTAYGTCGENLTWTLDADGLLTISGAGKMTEYSNDNRAPWFSNRTSIKSVKIESGVTSIGRYAFYKCTSLTGVEIPDSMTSIGNYTFASCASLTSIEIPDSVTSIGEYAFAYCTSLTGIEIPDSVTSVGDSAFEYCSSLTKVEIGAGVNRIGNRGFFGCTSLNSVEIGDSITNIGDNAFDYCTSLQNINVSADNKNYSSTDGVLLNKDKTILVCCPAGKSGAYSVPDGVISIYKCAFDFCNSLTSIKIGDSVTDIGSVAFFSCTSLSSVEIGNNVVSIGGYAFGYCSSLTCVEIPDSVASISSYAFESCTNLKSVYIGESVSSIGDNAFSNCSGITSVIYHGTKEMWNKVSIGSGNAYLTANIDYVIAMGNLGENETLTWKLRDGGKLNISGTGAITDYASADAVPWNSYKKQITGIVIEDGVTRIGNNAFSNCINAASLTIADSVSSIGDSAFYKCSKLTSITISDSIQSVGEKAFSYCTSLKDLVIESSETVFESNSFYGCGYSIQNLALPVTCDAAKLFPNGLTEITSLILTGDGAMHDYSDSSLPPWIDGDLEEVTFSGEVTSIGDYAFYRCTSLNSISIPESVDLIGSHAFYECTGLTGTLILYAGLNEIEDYGFYGCSGIKAIVLPDTLKSLGDYAFASMSSVKGKLSIPASVSSIGNGAFNGCSALSAINVDSSNSSYKSVDGVLYSADGSCLIQVPAGYSKSAITLEDVSTICKGALSSCKSLNSIKFIGQEPSIASNAFSGVTAEAYYPCSWASAPAGSYGGTITWTRYHNASKVEAKSPTPLEEGNIEYWRCSCGEHIYADENCTVELSAEDVVISKTKYGDVNLDGNINIEDVYMLRKAAAGLITLNDDQKAVADIYTDGRYNALDVNLLRRFIAGIVTEIPYNA